jgi:hypothetical protein
VFDWIGWLATAVFAVSYFCRNSAVMRRIQGLAALLWLSYGLLIGSKPLVVANAIVAGLALFSSLRPHAGTSPKPASRGEGQPVQDAAR